MKLTKKAMMVSGMRAVVLITITMVVLLGLGKIIVDFIQDSASNESCRNSVILSANIKSVVSGQKTVNLNCPTQQIEIVSTDLSKVKRQLADELYQCYWKFGEGKVDPFSEWGDDTKNVCAVCSVILFSDSVQNKVGTVNGFSKYLVETTIPQSTQTYYERMNSGISLTEQDKRAIISVEDTIDTSRKYATVFVINRQDSWSEFFEYTGIGATVGGTSAALLVGAYLVAPFTGGLSLFVVGGAVGLSSLAGGATGASVADQHQEMTASAVMLIPYDYEILSSKCTELGN